MLVVAINRANFEYDVHSIVKAFYPEETVKVLTSETGEQKREELEQAVALVIEMDDSGAVLRSSRELPGSDCREYVHGAEQPAGSVTEQPASSVAEQPASSVAEQPAGSVTEQPASSVAEQPAGSVTEQPASSVTEQPAGSVTEWNWKWDRDGSDTYKDGFKQFLYQTLSRITGKTLPWGNLTGIRPTKIAYSMLEVGQTEEEIQRFLQEKHFVSEEKSRLSIDIAARERELLSQIHYEGGYSLYIGIPFCPTTCLYCSFTSYAIGAYRKLVEDYIDCLIKEMEYVANEYKDQILDSVYIGGGTPTTLEAEQLDRLISHVRKLFDFSQVKEFTVEAGRADSITAEKLQVLYRHGVTRISINPQTMKQETLDIIGRRHTVEQVVEAYKLAREIGFTNINMDLILGLPGETPEDVARTIDRVVALKPDSLTVHSLAIKRASRLSQWIQEHGISALQNTDETMAIAAEGAKKLGKEPYYLYRQKNMSGNFENVGYAVPGKFGLYNILIMEEKQTIVALGAGASTKAVYPDGRIERCENVKDVTNYIARIDEMIERKRSFFKDFDF